MNSNLLFDFVVNKENNTILVKRAFAAPLLKVWAAWTQSELLDKWWAPKPYTSKTKSMNFMPGGSWIYAMVSPEGEEHWCRIDYLAIDTHKSFSGIDAFCDSEGNRNTAFPQATWNNAFSNNDNGTLVSMVIQYEKLEDIETIISMGFKEGFAMGLSNLDELLASNI